MSATSELFLNVGSGQRKFSHPLWINVDCQEKWNPDVVADGSHMPMFEDDNAEIIVLHHVLEHFGCGEAAGVLRECYRILRPGGSLIITVPDMEQLARGFLSKKISTQIYMTNVYGAYMDSEADRHKWGFTTASLYEFVRSMDWAVVKTFDGRNLMGADIAQDWWILGMEAVK